MPSFKPVAQAYICMIRLEDDLMHISNVDVCQTPSGYWKVDLRVRTVSPRSEIEAKYMNGLVHLSRLRELSSLHIVPTSSLSTT